MDQRLLLRGAGTTFHGRTKDISESGLGAIVAGELNADELLELEFYLPGKLDPVRLKATVRYHQGFHYGFQFVDITDEQRAMVRDAIMVLPPA